MTQKPTYKIIPSPLPCKSPVEVSVFVGSFLKTALRGLFSRLARRRLRKIKAGARHVEWRPLNNRLSAPLAVPFLMVNAPRWNTHASVLTAGPFSHSGDDVQFDGLPEGCCKAWALVIYNAISSETVAFFSSGTDARTLSLPSGSYGCGLRIYEPSVAIDIPGILSGDTCLVPACHFDPDTETDLRGQIFDRTSWFYRTLNAPVSQWLSTAENEKEPKLAKGYLPVGNPETLFLFGPIPHGGKLVVGAQALPDHTLCYLTTYNSASFPSLSVKLLPGQKQHISAAPDWGSFLVRVIPAKGGAADNAFLLDAVTVHHEPA